MYILFCQGKCIKTTKNLEGDFFSRNCLIDSMMPKPDSKETAGIPRVIKPFTILSHSLGAGKCRSSKINCCSADKGKTISVRIKPVTIRKTNNSEIGNANVGFERRCFSHFISNVRPNAGVRLTSALPVIDN